MMEKTGCVLRVCLCVFTCAQTVVASCMFVRDGEVIIMTGPCPCFSL